MSNRQKIYDKKLDFNLFVILIIIVLIINSFKFKVHLFFIVKFIFLCLIHGGVEQFSLVECPNSIHSFSLQLHFKQFSKDYLLLHTTHRQLPQAKCLRFNNKHIINTFLLKFSDCLFGPKAFCLQFA